MLHNFFEFIFRTLTDPDRLIHFLATLAGGWQAYLVFFAIVFSETGLLVGFFLPGDSLLFTIGAVAGAGGLDIVTIVGVLIVASILGDQCGYFLGTRAGLSIFDRPNSRFFKREYITETQRFYEKHGGKTLIYAKFVPIIRTFAPFMAGVGRMPYFRFLSFNIFGGLGWVTVATLGGYFLGQVPIVRRNFEKAVILVVLISVLPILLQYLRSRAAVKPATR
jgi:membrane-associated protein